MSTANQRQWSRRTVQAVALAGLLVGALALGTAFYTFVSQYRPNAPYLRQRSYNISIDFYNSTSGTTAYANSRFTPDTIIAYQGDMLTLNVTNRDPRPGLTHGFRLYVGEGPLNLTAVIDPGETYSATLDLTSVSALTYKYYCQLHDPVHLSGQLLVLPR